MILVRWLPILNAHCQRDEHAHGSHTCLHFAHTSCARWDLSRFPASNSTIGISKINMSRSAILLLLHEQQQLVFEERKSHRTTKYLNMIIPGLSQDVCQFCFRVLLFPTKMVRKKDINNHPILGQSRQNVYVYWASFLREESCSDHLIAFGKQRTEETKALQP